MTSVPSDHPAPNRRQLFKKSARHFWREWLRPFALLFLIVAPLRSAVVDWNWVPTGSMKPTILEGDLVLVNKLAYDLRVPFTRHRLATWANPARGDIAVCFSPTDGTRLVKRVIGLPGDVIECRNDVLWVNGVPQRYSVVDATPFRAEISEDTNPILAVEHLDATDHYIMALPHRPAVRSFGPVTLPTGQYFMMGDSRDNSHDSRFFGPVARSEVVGQANVVLVSFDRSRYFLPRLARFGQPLSRL